MDEDIVDGAVLDAHKENIAPNRNGHSATALQSTFSLPRNQRQQQLAEEKAKFNLLTQTALQESHDPLEAYVQFVKWTIDSYPAGKSSDSGLVPLLELATRTFKDYPNYKNDFRYLNLWLQYANVVSKPQLVYAYVLANDIGIWYAQLYEEYANHLEREGNRAKADEIYRLGIARKAMPLAVLQSRYNEYITRMLTAPQGSASVDALDASVAQTPQPGGRTVLGSRVSGQSASQPVSQAARPSTLGNRGKISVFVDGAASGSADHQTSEWKELDSQVALNKENTAEPTPWKGEKLPQRGAFTPRTPKISVFRDGDSDVPAVTPGKTADAIAIRAQKPLTEAELLFQDPFKNHDATQQAELDISAAIEAASASKSAVPTQIPRPASTTQQPQPAFKVPHPPAPQMSLSASTSAAATSVKLRPFVLPDPIPGKKPEKWMFNINLLWNEAQGKEFCIQEDRAKSLGLLEKKWAPPPPIQPPAPVGGLYTGRTMTMMREPTVTINTKAAMHDVFDMFNGTEEEDEFNDSAIFSAPPLTEPIQRPGITSGKGLSVHMDVPPTPTPPPGAGPRSLSFKPFTDAAPTPTPSNKTAATPKFTPFIDATPSQPTPVPTRIPLSAKTPLADSLPSRTPLGVPASAQSLQGTAQRETLDSRTPRQPVPAFRPFSDDDRAVVPPTPTPASSNVPAQLFSISSTIPEGPEANEDDNADALGTVTRPRSFKIFRDTENAQNTSQPYKSPPLQSAGSLENVFSSKPNSGRDGDQVSKAKARRSSGGVSFQVALSRKHQSPNGNVELDDVFSSPPLTTPTPADNGLDHQADDDWDSEDDEEHGAQQNSMYQDEHADEDGFEEDGRDEYRPLARFPPIHEMTPILERTCEYTRTSMASTSRKHSLAAETVSEENGDEQILDDYEEVKRPRPSLPSPQKQRRASRARQSRVSLVPTDTPAEEDLVLPNPCNPFEREILEAILTLIPAAFYDYRQESSGQLDRLQKFAAKKLKQSLNKSSGGVDTMPTTIGPHFYEVKDKIGEGGFGAVFKALIPPNDEDDTDVQEDMEVAIKVVRPPQRWEFTILSRIREVVDPWVLPSIILPRALYAFDDESFLVMDHCQYGTLLDCVNRAPGTELGSSAGGEGLVEALVMFFTVELFKVVEELHLNGFIHGDLKIDNCLVRTANVPGGTNAWSSTYDPSGANGWAHHGVCLIDFGRAIDTNLFPEDQTYTGDWPTDARDCIEMREGRPWTFETDYFGLAGIIYCMLFKKYIETAPAPATPEGHPRYKIATPLKRYWNTNIWSRVFDMLLNPLSHSPDGLLPIPDKMRELRQEMETWLVENSSKKNVKGLLRKIWLYNTT